MSTVDENRLKGNWGAAHVAALLSAECLVRPVAADTDVGVDLYCETVEESQPFLHFWMQVKAGAQCRVAADRRTATCSLSRKHLEYWRRQPVPVFAALVPADWPVLEYPAIYIVDITCNVLQSRLDPAQESLSLTSECVWSPGNRDVIKQFLNQVVPRNAALLKLKDGIVASIPSLQDCYFQSTPLASVACFTDKILTQIRKTAAFSIISLRYNATLAGKNEAFRRRLACIAALFDDDKHWETYAAQAFSCHIDGDCKRAVELYDRALAIISDDSSTHGVPWWEQCVKRLKADRKLAEFKQGLQNLDSGGPA